MYWTAEAVDQLMAADKTLLGDGDWQCDAIDRDCKLVFTLAIDGVPCGLSLQITDFPMQPSKGWTIIINAPPAVWRLDFDGPKEWHLNDVPEMHECPRLIYGPHYHPWRLNRAGVKRGRLPTELPLAMPLPAMRGFDATLHWFCDETRITIGKGQIPARPTPGTLL